MRPPREGATSPVAAAPPSAAAAAAPPRALVAAASPRVSVTAEAGRLLGQQAPLLAVLALAAFLRFWQLGAVGFNSDEAVYTGSAAALAGNTTLAPMFPVFRAHPLLFQSMLSIALRIHDTDWTARAFAAVIGVATVAATFALARSLYGRTAGLYAALLLAVMPYHVVVSRQVLLDGLMTLCATVALCCVVRYVESGRMIWLSAGGGMMGAAIITKETSVILLGGLYAFFALTPGRLRIRHLLLASLVMADAGGVVAADVADRRALSDESELSACGSCSGAPTTERGSTSPRCRPGSARRCCWWRSPGSSGCGTRAPGGNASCSPGSPCP